uniref:DUF4206 domain-containing protein n=1 Tax=Rhabditophanes sp. KR3021 TaxID=114890 RepID=A0AC35UGM3_9BILA
MEETGIPEAVEAKPSFLEGDNVAINIIDTSGDDMTINIDSCQFDNIFPAEPLQSNTAPISYDSVSTENMAINELVNLSELNDLMISQLESTKWMSYIKSQIDSDHAFVMSDQVLPISKAAKSVLSRTTYQHINYNEIANSDLKECTSESYESDHEIDYDETDIDAATSAEEQSTALKMYITNVSTMALNSMNKNNLIESEGYTFFKKLKSNPIEFLHSSAFNKIRHCRDESNLTENEKFIKKNSSAWHPLKQRFIFTIPEYSPNLLTTQKYRCAGCGLFFIKALIKKTLYCNYYGLYFCECCYEGKELPIPSRIISTWNFKQFPVSDIAYNFLMKNKDKPIFDLNKLDITLYERVKRLQQFRNLRYQLTHLWQFVKICDDARSLKIYDNTLEDAFQKLPQYYLELNMDLYSLADFSRIGTKQIIMYIKPMISEGIKHAERCSKCQLMSFTCEKCHSPDYLFPFQVDKTARCKECGCLFHINCYNEQKTFSCPKCKRIRTHQSRFEKVLDFNEDE